jgi:hypothetical protein
LSLFTTIIIVDLIWFILETDKKKKNIQFDCHVSFILIKPNLIRKDCHVTLQFKKKPKSLT